MMGQWGKFAIRYGVKSAYVLGIFCANELWGTINLLFCDENRRFSDDDLALFSTMNHLVELCVARDGDQKKLVEAMKSAQDAASAKSFFLASMTHEIRTPLNSLLGFVQLLQYCDLDAETMKVYTDGILQSGNLLLELISNILDLSKLESGHMPIVSAETDVVALVSDICNIFLPKAKEKSLSLTLHNETVPTLMLDKVRIRQVLTNLIGNAMKYTAKGGITVKTSFTTGSFSTGTLKIEIIDTGIGIAKEDISKLTIPYAQFSSAKNEAARRNSTGLGLAIARHLIEAMNGKLIIKSTLGSGSNFGFELYDVKYKFTPNVHLEAQPQRSEQVMEHPHPSSASISVLLVDDVYDNLKALQETIKLFGARSTVATSGNTALQLLRTNRFDLMITDLLMPNMNGDELAKRVRLLPQHENMVICVLTGDPNLGDDIDGSSFDRVLAKPFKIEEIKTLIADVKNGTVL